MSSQLRRSFTFPHYDMATWFPGHMNKGLVKMQQKIGDMDCVIEVHDARIPFTGRNPVFNRHAKMRPHILILNKMDLVNKKSLKWLKENTDKLQATKVIVADLKNRPRAFANQIIDETLEVIDHTERFHRWRNESYNLLVVGIPNVGKSSLINFLRNNSLGKKGRATRVGGDPGMTKAVLEKIRICDDPHIFLYDTPGILTPKIESAEVALKLAACNTVRSRVLGEELICDYMLYHLNKNNLTRYTELYGLDKPNDNIHEVLTAIAAKHDKFLKRRFQGEYKMVHDYQFAASKMLKDFNRGLLGYVNLDSDLMLPSGK